MQENICRKECKFTLNEIMAHAVIRKLEGHPAVSNKLREIRVLSTIQVLVCVFVSQCVSGCLECEVECVWVCV